MKSTETPRQPITIAAVDKALLVIETLLDLNDNGATLGHLAELTSINKSSLHHTLATLKARRWVVQDEDGLYHLGPITGRIAQWWTSSDQAVSRLHPTLVAICGDTHELVHLGRLYGDTIVYLDKVEPDRPVRVWSRIGQSAPVATTAMGRAIIGARHPTQAERTTWLSLIADRPPHLESRLTEELERVRTSGYAVEVGEDRPSLACVGVPISLAGSPNLAISVTVPIERATLPRLDEIAQTIQQYVRDNTPTGINLAADPQFHQEG